MTYYLAISIILGGCDDTGSEIHTGYMKLTYAVIYPQNTDVSAYVVTFNGKNISNTYFSREELDGKLQVYSKGSGTPEIDSTLTLEPNQKLQLIKLPGKKIELYNEKNYIQINASLALFTGYTAYFSGQELVGGINYLKTNDSNGVVTVYKNGETSPIYTSENIEIIAGQNLNLIQQSETDFLILSGNDDVEDPATKNLSKVRFIYTPSEALSQYETVRMDIIAYNAYTADDFKTTTSVILKKGKLSDYIELDMSLYKDRGEPTGFGFSLYDENDNSILDFYTWYPLLDIARQSSNDYEMKYKIQTWQIIGDANNGLFSKFVMGTEWNSASTE